MQFAGVYEEGPVARIEIIRGKLSVSAEVSSDVQRKTTVSARIFLDSATAGTCFDDFPLTHYLEEATFVVSDTGWRQSGHEYSVKPTS